MNFSTLWAVFTQPTHSLSNPRSLKPSPSQTLALKPSLSHPSFFEITPLSTSLSLFVPEAELQKVSFPIKAEYLFFL
jgi:hypothetical protein